MIGTDRNLYAAIIEWREEPPAGSVFDDPVSYRTGRPVDLSWQIGLIVGWQPIVDPDDIVPPQLEPVILRAVDVEADANHPPFFLPRAQVIPAFKTIDYKTYRTEVRLFADDWQAAHAYAHARAEQLNQEATRASTGHESD